MKSKNKKRIANIIVLLLLLISVLASAYLYYCPADYVKTSNGEIYIRDGKPYIYHTDVFGKTFIFEDGVRVYVTIPDYMD